VLADPKASWRKVYVYADHTGQLEDTKLVRVTRSPEAENDIFVGRRAT
jgi:hypothetical protein